MTALNAAPRSKPAAAQWLVLGALAAAVATAAVLIVLALAIAIWPDIALFKPLDSYARAALFTIIPAFAATGLLARVAIRIARGASISKASAPSRWRASSAPSCC